jgi:L-2-hydroxyglutarate oxidase LhgO
VGGYVDVGPNAVLAFAREGYKRTDINFHDVKDIVTWPGFRQIAKQHWRMGMNEYAGSFSRRIFMNRARKYLPAIGNDDVVPAPAGVRAQAVDRDGTLVDDFRINHLGAVTAVRNAPSPAATSSLAIAEYVGEQVLAHSRSSDG